MIKIQTETSVEPEEEQDAPEVAETAVEFINVPIELIETGPQIRTGIDPEGESIRALAETIREKGMIQPLGACGGPL